MAHKGHESQRNANQREYLVRIGKEKPVEYTLTATEALKAAGIPL